VLAVGGINSASKWSINNPSFPRYCLFHEKCLFRRAFLEHYLFLQYLMLWLNFGMRILEAEILELNICSGSRAAVTLRLRFAVQLTPSTRVGIFTVWLPFSKYRTLTGRCNPPKYLHFFKNIILQKNGKEFVICDTRDEYSWNNFVLHERYFGVHQIIYFYLNFAVTDIYFKEFLIIFGVDIHSFIHSYSCCSLWNIGHPWNSSFHFSFLIL
jgi:hypothetical protein